MPGCVVGERQNTPGGGALRRRSGPQGDTFEDARVAGLKLPEGGSRSPSTIGGITGRDGRRRGWRSNPLDVWWYDGGAASSRDRDRGERSVPTLRARVQTSDPAAGKRCTGRAGKAAGKIAEGIGVK